MNLEGIHERPVRFKLGNRSYHRLLQIQNLAPPFRGVLAVFEGGRNALTVPEEANGCLRQPSRLGAIHRYFIDWEENCDIL